MKSLILISLFFGASAQARVVIADQYFEINQRVFIQQQTRCVTEYMTLLSQSESVSKACHVSKPLRLSTTVRNYPHLNANPRTVQYWEGSVAKTITNNKVYLRELVDECRGRIISSMRIKDSSLHEEGFDILNPNLDLSINESFMLSPMTSDEAKQALAAVQQECL